MINKRKFDIRIWTCLTSVSPLISWVYEEFYVRLTAKDYNENDNNR